MPKSNVLESWVAPDVWHMITRASAPSRVRPGCAPGCLYDPEGEQHAHTLPNCPAGNPEE
jgi:hypothetical protein